MLSSDGHAEASVIVPAYNEEERISSFLDKLVYFAAESSVSYEIPVIADGCTDATEEMTTTSTSCGSGLGSA